MNLYINDNQGENQDVGTEINDTPSSALLFLGTVRILDWSSRGVKMLFSSMTQTLKSIEALKEFLYKAFNRKGTKDCQHYYLCNVYI